MPGGPGGPEVGRASVRVAPDTSLFASELRKKLNAIENSEKLEIPVKFNADREQLQRELESLRVKAINVPLEFSRREAKENLDAALAGLKGGPVPVTVKFEIDREKLRAALARMRNTTTVQVKFEIDRAKLRADLAKMRNTANVQVKFQLDRAGLRAAVTTATAALKPKVKVTLTPDLTDFRAKMANLPNGRASVTLNPDTAAFRTRLSNLTGRVNVTLNPNITEFRAKLKEIKNARVDVTLNVPQSEITALQAKLATLDGKNVRITIDIDGIAEAIAQILVLEAALNRLDGQNIRVTLDVDGLAAALAQLAAFSAAIAALNGINAGSGGSAGAFRAVRMLASIVGFLLQAILLAPLVIVAGAAITAAWGAISAAIVGLPAILAAIAVPIAAVAIGIEGIKKAAKTLEPEFKKLQTAVENSFEKSFTNAFKIIKPIFPAIQSGFVAVADAIGPVVTDLALMAKHAVETGVIPGIFDKVQASLRNISPSLSNLVNSFLELMNQKSAFQAFESIINDFSASWSDMVQEVIADGTLDKAMSGLGEVMGSLEKGFVSLVKNGIELFGAAAPGISDFLDDLTGFFNRFDWTKLGKSVGDVFSGLGETLKGIPDADIKAIEDAFTRMGDLFKNPDFQKGVQDFVRLIPDILDTVTDLADAFGKASTAFKGFLDGFKEGEGVYQDGSNALLDFLKWVDELPWNKNDDLLPNEQAFGGKNPFDFLKDINLPDLKDLFDGLWDDLNKDLPTADDFDFSGEISEAFDEAVDAAKKGAEEILKAFSAGNGGASGWDAMLAALGQSISRGMEEIQVDATIASHNLEEALKPLGGDVVTPWANLVKGIATAVTTGLATAGATVKTQVDAIRTALEPPLGIAALWVAAIATIGTSITLGMTAAAAVATGAADVLATALQPPLALAQAWTDAITGINTAIATGMATAVTTGITQGQALMTALAPVGDPAAAWTAALAGLAGAVTTQMNAAVNAAKGGSAAIAASLAPPGDLAGPWITGLGAIVNTISGTLSLAQFAVQGGMDGIRQAFAAGFQGLGQIATDGLAEVETAVNEKMTAIIDKVKELGQQLADALADIKPTSSIGDAVKQMFEDFRAIITESIKGVFTIIQDTIKAQVEGVTGIFTTIAESFSEGFRKISEAIANATETVSTSFDNLKTVFADKITAIKEALTTAFSGDIGASIIAAFQGIGIGIGNAITDIGNKITLGVQTWKTAIDGALTLITTSFQTKPLAWGLPVQAAMTDIGNKITLGTAGWKLTIDTALQGISDSFTTKTLAWSLPVQAAMTAISNIFILGTTGWKATINAALLAISAAFTTGTAGWQTSITAALNAITAAFATAGTSWPTSIQNAMTVIRDAIVNGMNLARDAVVDGIQVMTDAFTNFGQTITTIVGDAMNAFTAAIQNGMETAKSTVQSAIDQMVAAVESGIEKFRAAGENMGNALAAGLEAALPRVKAAAAALAAAAATATAATAKINSPSKVFVGFGLSMGEGLEDGLRGSVPGVIREAKKLSDAVADAVDMPVFEASTWAADLQTNLKNGTNEINAALVRAGGAHGRQVQITNQFYTDASARDSDVVARVQRRQAALGMFA